MSVKYRPRYNGSASGYKGVYLEQYRKHKKWRAMIRVVTSKGRKTFHIGYYLTPKEASEAYEDYQTKIKIGAMDTKVLCEREIDLYLRLHAKQMKETAIAYYQMVIDRHLKFFQVENISNG